MLSFVLDRQFVDQYRARPEPFGFGALGAVTFYRTYSRIKDNGKYESWADACERVINGMYSIQKDYCVERGIPFDTHKATMSAREAFDRLFNFKWSPPGRGLSHMGAPSVHERGMYEAVQNCSFISTEHIRQYRGEIFSWIMEMLMLGVGVGSDMRGTGKIDIVAPSSEHGTTTYVIPDSREGWAESLAFLVNSYMPHGYSKMPVVQFNYDSIRPKGAAIKGFGGIASGPEPLRWMHEKVRDILNDNDGAPITTKTLADIINMIGVVVVAGNVRRSSEILLGNKNDQQFVNLKNSSVFPDRTSMESGWAWASNNTILGDVGMDYSPYLDNIMSNGEPGFLWLENVNNYARMNGIRDTRDLANGTNPCSEQVLYGYSPAGLGGEMCTLCEVYLPHHTDRYDFYRSLKFAYLYGKTITLLSDKMRHPGTRDIMQQNRRIGLSLTGIAQFVGSRGVHSAIDWMDNGYKYVEHYDHRYSDWFSINRSIRTTSVKPSGTVSLVAGVTPGVHYPHSIHYIRRMRLAESSHLVAKLEAAGIPVEPSVTSSNTVVASFPVSSGGNLRPVSQVSIWEQFQMAAMAQKYWSDNSVSVTISVNPKTTTKEEVKFCLDHFQHQLKSVSLLPLVEGGAYAQMPYEEITEEQFASLNSKVKYEMLASMADETFDGHNKMADMYCDGDACEIKVSTENSR